MDLRVKVGKGVLGKDGRPYAPGTIHGVTGVWSAPVPYTVAGLVGLLVDPAVTEIRVIDGDNTEFTLTAEGG